MSYTFLEHYHSWREDGNNEAAHALANELYRVLGRWHDETEIDSELLSQFWDLFSRWSIRDHLLARNSESELGTIGQSDGHELIELGLMHTAEAIAAVREGRDSPETIRYFLNEARLPFYAFIDEPGYRLTRSQEFGEVDFQIYELIGEPFPHDAARQLLVSDPWVDIWSTLRYIEGLDEREEQLQLIEQIIRLRQTLPEQVILLSWLLFHHPEEISDLYDSSPTAGSFQFTRHLPQELAPSLYHTLQPFIESYTLDTAWEERVSPIYFDETLFALLALYEICRCTLTPGWVRLFELGLQNNWSYREPLRDELDEEPQLHFPVLEFTISALSLLSNENLQILLETSLVLPNFFGRMDDLSEEQFVDLLSVFYRSEGIFLHELEILLPDECDPDQEQILSNSRLQECAIFFDHEIVVENRQPRMVLRDTPLE